MTAPSQTGPGEAGRPNIARIYDYWLGGTDNFEADRKAGEAIRSIRPEVAGHALENKQFLTRAVTHLAGQGIRQFVDVGAGLPTSPASSPPASSVPGGKVAPRWQATHEAARAVVPDATVAYVDYDPVAVQHSRAVLARQDLAGVGRAGVVAVDGDMLEPEAILADPVVAAAGFDVAEPATVLLACVLHFVPGEVARDVVSRFKRILAPGSYLVISVGFGRGRAGSDFARTYNAQDGSRIYQHSWAEIAAWFDGLDQLAPGLGDVTGWRPDPPEYVPVERESMIVGGVARKP